MTLQNTENLIFLDEDFIKSARYAKFIKAVREEKYIVSAFEKQVLVGRWVSDDWYLENGYDRSTWLYVTEYSKSFFTDEFERKEQQIYIIKEYGTNRKDMESNTNLKSIKLYINHKFIKDYTENIENYNIYED